MANLSSILPEINLEKLESHTASQKIQERVVGISDEAPLTLPIITFCERTPRLNRQWLLFCRIILYNSKPAPGTGLSDRHPSDPLGSLKMLLLWNSVTSDLGCWSSYWIIFPWKEKFVNLEMLMSKRFPLPHLVQGLQLLIFISAYPGNQSFEDWKTEAIHTIKECWTRVSVLHIPGIWGKNRRRHCLTPPAWTSLRWRQAIPCHKQSYKY